MNAELASPLTTAQWEAEGTRLFGPDKLAWRFVCPACKHVAAASDWRDAGAPEGAVAFSCVGRWTPNPRDAFTNDNTPGPCNYAGGGLFRLNPVPVEDHQLFAFAAPL
jgi:hypothetical protein